MTQPATFVKYCGKHIQKKEHGLHATYAIIMYARNG